MTVTIGGTGETVRANVGACSGATGTTTTTSALTVRSVDLKVANPTGEENAEHHRGTTTTATTTTTHS